VVLTEKVEKCL